MLDLLIAGGGPVGMITALYAARAGLDVVVSEPRTGPIDKACGEGLMPAAVQGLAELGVEPAGRSIAGIRYVDNAHRAETRFTTGQGQGVRRTTLHTALTDVLETTDVTLEPSAVKDVEDRGDHLLVDGRETRFLVAADGLHSPVRRMVGLDAPSQAPRRFAQRVHARTVPWTDFVEVHWSSHGEAYVTPTADDQVGIAVLTSSRGRHFDDLITDYPELAARLAGSSLSKVRGAGPLRQRSRHRVRGRVLLVGDAAGYVDALTGEGIALGVAQARSVVAAIAAGDPRRYEREWRRLTWRHDLMTKSLVTATRASAVRSRIVPVAQHLPFAFSWAVNQLAKPA